MANYPVVHSEYTAAELQAGVGKNPIVGENGHFWIWNMTAKAYQDTGVDANGETIESIERTSGTGAAGTKDTYTITTSRGSTFTFEVWNGINGTGAVNSVNGKAGDVELKISDFDNDAGYLTAETLPVAPIRVGEDAEGRFCIIVKQ